MGEIRANRGTRDTRGVNGVVEPPLPQQAAIIYRHDIYDGNTTPQVGSYTYTRTGTLATASDQTTVTSYGANTLPLGRCFGESANLNGAWLGGSIKNWLLHSEDFSNAAWIKTSCTITANDAVAPDGTTTADKINAASGSYVTQDSGQAPSSHGFVGSIWLRSVTGTTTAQLQVFDGGSQKTFVDCQLTTTWRRFQIPKKFDSGTSTGTVSFRVKTDADIYVWGAQLERFTNSNTVGSRSRYGIANEYVKTTTAAADTGNGTYVIPNSVVTQIANTGSLQMGVYLAHDVFDSGFELLWSCNAEQFAMYINGGRLQWYWNNSIIASTKTANDFMRWFQPYAWNHLCVTWNCTTDVYKIYINGVDVTGTTTTASNLTTSTYTLTIGNYNPTAFPYIAADAWINQVVIWNTALSAADVAQAYASKIATYRPSTPSTGLLFEADFGTSLVPTTGDDEYYYSPRGYGSWYYPDSATTLAALDWTAKPTAYPLNGGGVGGGLPFNSNNQNLCLQSENIGTTWTAVGAPTLNATAGTFLGTLNYGTINGVSGDGITQDITAPASFDEYVGSVYASVASGTLACRLVLVRDPAGAAQTITKDITLTTTPQRFSIYALFSANVTTTVRFQFLLQATGTARVGGFQLEPAGVGSGTRALFNKIGSPYQKTTTTAANAGWLFPVYRAKNSINPSKGTAIAWAYLDQDPGTEFLNSNGPVLFAMPGQGKNLYWNVAPNQTGLQAHNITNACIETPFSLTPRTWTHFACTWDRNATTAQTTYNLYVNGVLVQTNTQSSTVIFEPGKFTFGADYVYGAMDWWSGAVGQVRIYGEAKDATFIDADYDNTKADYGL